ALTTLGALDIRFEFECYDTSHLYNLKHFFDRGLVKPPLFVQTVFGILGGIVRVGLEDSLWKGAGQLATNAEQVQLARQIVEDLGLSLATPDEAREILGLKGKDRVNI